MKVIVCTEEDYIFGDWLFFAVPLAQPVEFFEFGQSKNILLYTMLCEKYKSGREKWSFSFFLSPLFL